MNWALWCLTAVVASVQAQILTKGGTVTVKEGEPYSINCPTKNPSSDSIIWKKNGEVIAVDEDILTSEDGYEIVLDGANSTLTILRVEPRNSATYACAMTDPAVEVEWRITVNAPPVISISPDSGFYNVRVEDKNVVLHCFVKGNPKPSVQWTFQNGQLPSGVKHEANGAKIVIPLVSKEHAGKYVCEARNVAGNAKKSVNLVVDETGDDVPGEKPWVKTELAFIPVRKNANVNVSCTYDGTPIPQVEWFFNGYKINLNEERFQKAKEYAQRLNGYSRTTMQITEINEESFGDYACRISNKLGSVKAAVHVSGMPGPPALSLNTPELSWTVQAYEKVLEYSLCHRFEKQDTWLEDNCESIRVSKNDNHGDDKWEHTVDLSTYLEHGVRYEIQLRARNALGWGSYATDYITVEIPRPAKEPVKSASIAQLGAALLSAIIYIFVL